MKNLKIPLIVLIALVFTSFLPVIQILLMYLNSLVLSIFEMMGISFDFSLIILNAIFTLIGMIWFYFAKTKIGQMISVFVVILFCVPLAVYLLESKVPEESVYFLQILLAGIFTGIVLIFVGLVRNLNETH